MMEIETSPGTGVLIALFVGFVILGFAALSGTLAIAIWLGIGVVVFVLAYAALTRAKRWAEGQRGQSRDR